MTMNPLATTEYIIIHKYHTISPLVACAAFVALIYEIRRISVALMLPSNCMCGRSTGLCTSL
ncbi:hypothetical protein P691DRAFT_325108 [Macrolepiota fuliginosa MF-IS2]|uniref:Uncharacterized protein n=1 Tax=Macrolepiota fuliginosa MF-IS2 TaxID=1400762 RepID=A0A9P6C0J5_9AGAR|nr:hypothetical protein P691DRAFT_325108 [Macrolepiota fuliginosa MF-IS2]